MSIKEEDMMINLYCIENGIVPYAGVTCEHVKNTLSKMSIGDRRVVTRKYRKILKKAARHSAKNTCSMRFRSTKEFYKITLDRIMHSIGLKISDRAGQREKLTSSQMNCRRHLITYYVRESILSNS